MPVIWKFVPLIVKFPELAVNAVPTIVGWLAVQSLLPTLTQEPCVTVEPFPEDLYHIVAFSLLAINEPLPSTVSNTTA